MLAAPVWSDCRSVDVSGEFGMAAAGRRTVQEGTGNAVLFSSHFLAAYGYSSVLWSGTQTYQYRVPGTGY